MRIAVIGCSHGEVDKIYEVIEAIEKKNNITVDLVLCCGDFQSVRNMTDLRCMACPIKYQAMHDFYRYYSGEKKASKLTLFIGGNHEASNFLQELPYGGWVAPNIYYCGYANLLRFGPLRIASLSGIFKGRDYLRGRFEVPPYDSNTMRSVYHYRNLDIFRLKQITKPVDVMLSHDWPLGIYSYGDTRGLLRRKPFFREQIENDDLGSRPLSELLNELQPRYWFAAHLHVKFAAVIPFHHDQEKEGGEAEVESERDVVQPRGSSEFERSKVGSGESENFTQFLALDKVLPGRPFLQIIEIPTEEPLKEGWRLSYDPQWLAVLKSTDALLVPKSSLCYMPNETGTERYDYTPSKEELAEIHRIFDGNFEVPENFEQTVPSYEEGEQPRRAFPIENPQTTLFTEKLGIRDPLRLVADFASAAVAKTAGEEEITEFDMSLNDTTQVSLNPDEISLAEDDDDELVENEDQSQSVSPSGKESERSIIEPSVIPKLSKLTLPPPKSEVGALEEGSEPLATGSNQSFSTELDILRSVMGSTEASVELDSGISFSLDRVGEPQIKRQRNRRFYADEPDHDA